MSTVPTFVFLFFRLPTYWWIYYPVHPCLLKKEGDFVGYILSTGCILQKRMLHTNPLVLTATYFWKIWNIVYLNFSLKIFEVWCRYIGEFHVSDPIRPLFLILLFFTGAEKEESCLFWTVACFQGFHKFSSEWLDETMFTEWNCSVWHPELNCIQIFSSSL